jgi:signal transduction histidine kinase/CheY-like chemotaxis protein
MSSLETVRVPAEMADPFAKAEAVVSSYFRERRDDPQHGTIEIHGQRYVLVRAASLSVEFFTLVADLYGPGREAEAESFSRNLLYDLAHAIGKSDAHAFHTAMGLTDPLSRLSAGPVHFAHAGWAFVDILPGSRAAPGEDFLMYYDHPYAFESDAWLRAGRTSAFPVCIMNAGYSSGWCEESFGVELVSSEVLCRAKGDERCRFVMAHPNRIEAAIGRFVTESGLGPRVGAYQIPDFFVRKRVEEELRQSRAELERRVEARTRELQEANERLRREMEERARVEEQLRRTQKLEAVGRLAGGVAHDFNNIMSVILSRGALAASRLAPGDPLRAELDEIAHAARRAATLTRNLLAFSRGQVLSRETLDLNAMVTDVTRLLRPLIGEDLELDVRLGADAGVVLVDRGQLEQVVTNLVMNAREAMPAGGALAIETSAVALAAGQVAELAAGRYATLTVTDAGHGMDEATLARVFEPFFTTKERGTGLGLSTVYGIVKQSGGHVAVTSELGRGTRFTLWFPAAEGEARVTPTPHERAADPLRGDEELLLVEDQPSVRASIRAILVRYGYRVHEASDAASALKLAEAHPGIALVITDVVMPRMGGRELVERLLTRRPSLAVIFMSGYAEDFALGEGASAAAVSCLQKPFPPELLLQRIRDLLSARGTLTPG